MRTTVPPNQKVTARLVARPSLNCKKTDGRGGLAGVLDASSGSTVRQQHTAALVEMSVSNVENSLLRAGHDRRVVLLFHPRPEYLGTLSVGMPVLDDDFCIHAVNRKGCLCLTGFGPLIRAEFSQVFDTDFEMLARRLTKGETLRLRDRMESAVSMRCVANRASFAMAGRGQTMTVPAPRNLFRDVVIEDAALLRALSLLPAAAQRGLTITVSGETGTGMGMGKEITARLAHAAAARPGAFVAFNAKSFGARADDMLFGTSAEDPGLLAQASGGTLYLDDVSALPATTQAALIRVLDQGHYRRAGDVTLHKTDLQVVSSSLVPASRFTSAASAWPPATWGSAEPRSRNTLPRFSVTSAPVACSLAQLRVAELQGCKGRFRLQGRCPPCMDVKGPLILQNPKL